MNLTRIAAGTAALLAAAVFFGLLRDDDGGQRATAREAGVALKVFDEKGSSRALAVDGVQPSQEHKRATRPISRAPWVQLQTKYDEGDFRWLVENARAAPELGSYSYAIQALLDCREILFFGSEEQQISNLESTDFRDRALRIQSMRQLFKPCRGLGSFEDMNRQLHALTAELKRVSDSRNEMIETAHRTIVDRSIPLQERERLFRQLLELNDADAATALKGAITAEGALFNGEALSSQERAELGTAWEMALCEIYGRCMGANARAALLNCALRSDCAFQTTPQVVQQYAPMSWAESMPRYRTMVTRALKSGNYSIFRLPQ